MTFDEALREVGIDPARVVRCLAAYETCVDDRGILNAAHMNGKALYVHRQYRERWLELTARFAAEARSSLNGDTPERLEAAQAVMMAHSLPLRWLGGGDTAHMFVGPDHGNGGLSEAL